MFRMNIISRCKFLYLVLLILAMLLICAGCVRHGDEESLLVQSIGIMKTYGGETLQSGEIIQPGDSIDVEAVVESTVDTSAAYNIELRINGEVHDYRVAKLDAADVTTIIFTLSFDEEGSYELTILSESVTVKVETGAT